MAISHVGVSTVWSSTASSTAYTVNLPAGSLANGDLMIAVLAWTTDVADTDLVVTPPTGWTLLDDLSQSGNSVDCQLAVMIRRYASGDPSDWTDGALSSTAATAKVSATAAYAGVQSVLASGTSSAASPALAYASASVSNSLATSWRFLAGAAEAPDLLYDLGSDEASSRVLTDTTALVVQLLLADSGAAVGVGDTSRTLSRPVTFDASASWIALLEASTLTPATGILGISLSPVVVAGAGLVDNPATVALALGHISITADGLGQPIVASGSLSATLGHVTVAAQGDVVVDGAMTMAVLPTISFLGETRVFGVRVITVEADDRTIQVQSRGVDD